METYTVEQAKQHAEKFCKKNPGWKMICDIENSDKLYCTWKELGKAIKERWRRKFGDLAETAWEELGTPYCKVPYGFISGAGVFYDEITDIPLNHNSMMIFKIN